MKRVITENEHRMYFTPAYSGKEQFYCLRQPDLSWQPLFFMTATSGLRVVKNPQGVFIEHLKVDGTVDLLPYKHPGIGGPDNWINFGWKKDNQRKFLRVDIYTGENLYVEDLNG